MSSTTPPRDLSTAGKALWAEIAGEYALRPDELATLHGAARAADMIAALREAWDDADKPMLTAGSMGQQVIHPLIGELRTQESQKAALLARLKLPDEGSKRNSGDMSTPARKAAAARWSHGA